MTTTWYPDLAHGTRYARYERGCSCEECKTAARRWEKRRVVRLSKAGPPEHVHGTVNGFDRYGCRCDLCRAANAARSKAYRERRRRPA